MYWSYSFYAFGLKSLPVNFTAVQLKLRSVGPGSVVCETNLTHFLTQVLTG